MNLTQKIFYPIKPFFPRSFQIALRRLRVALIRKKYENVWPINETTGNPPEGWPGWPDDKQFAVVLTHDVETKKGQGKCIDLMNIEKKLGFKSSFNFVPEAYKNSLQVHRELKKHGFEVGIHGLKHDGRLYNSKKMFQNRASSINRYMSEWQAVGFRSPGMHHNLEWAHALNIEYDASTYDIDPFEPQGGGAGTIFPFIVKDSFSQKSYVELPYTLPQDFLLFVLMEEKNIDIWKRKLDWIAQQGGMVLLITHPDYMNFNKDKPRKEQYPAEYYNEFLNYIKSKYAGQYWQATPREIAGFWKDNMSNSIITGDQPKTCMVVFSYYPSDVRVRREAEALVEAGYSVDVICLKAANEASLDVFNGVTTHRISMKKLRKGKISYIMQYLIFSLLAFFKTTTLYLKNHYKIIHVHNMPDILVVSAIIPKLFGAKVTLDLHDPTPEVYMSKYNINHKHPAIKLLEFCEKICIRFADLVITPNISFRDLFISRGCPADKVHIIMNSPQDSVFKKENVEITDKNSTNNMRFRIMFHGTIVERHGLDIALEVMQKLRCQIPELEFLVYGGGDFVNNFLELREKLNLKDIVHYGGEVSLEKIVSLIKTIDLGLIPNKRSPFTEINMPTRIFEYLCLGKPVVAPRTQGIMDYFNENEIYFFEPDNIQNLHDTILKAYKSNRQSSDILKRGIKIYKKYSWEKQSADFIEVYDRLCS